MDRSPLYEQVISLPDLVRPLVGDFAQRVSEVFPQSLCREITHVTITGCGDSHHAALNARMAFEQIAGLPCEPQTAMQFSRYTAPFLANKGKGKTLLVGISVSGRVSRTIEALDLGRQAGAITVAVTGSRKAPLARTANFVLETAVPPMPGEFSGIAVPGCGSYFASQLALYILAIHLGRQREVLSEVTAKNLRLELLDAADLMAETIANCDKVTSAAAHTWKEEASFVFCGSGPNFGSAFFSAAKLLEASGDAAMAQDIEEWAHLQYFARARSTPTILISAANRDSDRVLEIATAAHTIGRQVAIIAPANSSLAKTSAKDFLFPLAGTIQECFSPMLASIPGILLASHRAQILGEPYFRGFGGGRSAAGGGGISRIRNSHRIEILDSG